MAGVGLIDLRDAVFTAEGREIHFRKASLTAEGSAATADTEFQLLIKQQVEKKAKGRKKAGRKASKPKGKRGSEAENVEMSALEQTLRKWRLAEAKKQGVPAFRILSDKTLHAIASEKPGNEDELLSISGISAKVGQRYGAQILKMVEQA
jgi:superfamily II DNA helicase RecQ